MINTLEQVSKIFKKKCKEIENQDHKSKGVHTSLSH